MGNLLAEEVIKDGWGCCTYVGKNNNVILYLEKTISNGKPWEKNKKDRQIKSILERRFKWLKERNTILEDK